MKIIRFKQVLACSAAVLAIWGCGGEDGPAPAPVATGTPTPSPTPTPTPTPTPGPTIAGVQAGGRLPTQFVCAGIPAVTRTDSRITAIGALAAPPATAGYSSLEYIAPDSFQFDVNGFGGSRFLPSSKRSPVSSGHDIYITLATGAGPSEFQLWNAVGSGGLQYATVGMLAEDYDGGSLCFFAAGAAASQIPTSNGFDHIGRIDGLSQLGGRTRRLQGSDFLLTMNYATGSGSIEINLVTCDDPFGNVAACTKEPFGKFTGTVTLANGSLSGNLQGPNGMTGRLNGQFFSTLALGVGFTFSLSDTEGRRAIGAAAGDLRQI